MKNLHQTASHWATAADGSAPETSPGELTMLGDHLACCKTGAGSWRAAAEHLHGFAAPRVITTLAAVTAVLAAAAVFF